MEFVISQIGSLIVFKSFHDVRKSIQDIFKDGVHVKSSAIFIDIINSN